MVSILCSNRDVCLCVNARKMPYITPPHKPGSQCMVQKPCAETLACEDVYTAVL